MVKDYRRDRRAGAGLAANARLAAPPRNRRRPRRRRSRRDPVNAAVFSAQAGKPAKPAKAEPKAVQGPMDPVVLKAQILLDRAGFSPGAIDAIDGENYAKALDRVSAAERPRRDRQARRADLVQAHRHLCRSGADRIRDHARGRERTVRGEDSARPGENGRAGSPVLHGPARIAFGKISHVGEFAQGAQSA